ncbi:hypothetical protein PV325_003932, partial [Microctonus aethiopoides]
HFKIWLKNVFFSIVESKSLLLIDSWTGHCPDAVKSVKPSDNKVEVIIPKGTTGNIQSLDVLGFRVWKFSGYTVVKLDTFENPVKFAFGDGCKSHCDILECENIAIIRYSWCKKSLCLKHFFDDYHKCSMYNE